MMAAHELENMVVLNVKGAVFRCILSSISRDEAVKRLNNSELDDKGVY